MRAFLMGVLWTGLLTGGAGAFTFQIDTSNDTGGFFTLHPEALTALNKAASDLSAVIKPSLNAVPSDQYLGSVGNPADPSTVLLNWNFSFPSPSNTSTTVKVDAFNFAADVFKVYAGARVLSGSELGEGSSVGVGVEVTSPTGFYDEELAAAAAQAQALSNAGMRGTKGPLIDQLNTSVGNDDIKANLALRVGALAGVVSFTTVTNWHFDINTQPGALESDFYSVALHELIHTLGVGASDTWVSLKTGTNWSGPAVGALTSGGMGVISTGGDHIAEGLKSPVLVNTGGVFSLGAMQEVSMDPSLNNGVRKQITQLDLAFLKDLGYDVVTVAVPEPDTVLLLGLAAGVAVVFLRRRRA